MRHFLIWSTLKYPIKPGAGRAGATGEAYTFFTSQDGRHAGQLAKVMREAGQVVPPELERMGAFGGGGGGGGRGGTHFQGLGIFYLGSGRSLFGVGGATGARCPAAAFIGHGYLAWPGMNSFFWPGVLHRVAAVDAEACSP